MCNPTNEERAARIDKLIEYYAVECKGDAYADETDPQDIICDIMHWCDRDGYNFEEFLSMARFHHEAERITV